MEKRENRRQEGRLGNLDILGRKNSQRKKGSRGEGKLAEKGVGKKFSRNLDQGKGNISESLNSQLGRTERLTCSILEKGSVKNRESSKEFSQEKEVTLKCELLFKGEKNPKKTKEEGLGGKKKLARELQWDPEEKRVKKIKLPKKVE